MFDTDRRGERVSIAGCLRATAGVGLGLTLGLVLGVLDFDLSGAGDRGLRVLGVRGVFGVGGVFLWKWHGRVTFFLSSPGDCSGRRAGTGMRLGVPC